MKSFINAFRTFFQSNFLTWCKRNSNNFQQLERARYFLARYHNDKFWYINRTNKVCRIHFEKQEFIFSYNTKVYKP